MDICVLRSGMELATAEVKGDIAKARKELSKQNKVATGKLNGFLLVDTNCLRTPKE